jgi:hypothetical protein
MKRKSPKSKRPAKRRRSTKPSKKHNPFVFGELLVLDKGKVDMTPRPTTIKNFRELILKEFGELPPVRKPPLRKKKA